MLKMDSLYQKTIATSWLNVVRHWIDRKLWLNKDELNMEEFTPEEVSMIKQHDRNLPTETQI